jgi:hypothetical protein
VCGLTPRSTGPAGTCLIFGLHLVGGPVTYNVRPCASRSCLSRNEECRVLIKPFGDIWRSLAAQGNAWVAIHNLITRSIQIPARLDAVRKESMERGAALSETLSTLIAESEVVAREAATLAASQQQAIVYPGLVGAWAIVEAAFDDLMLSVLSKDTESLEKLRLFGMKPRSDHPVGTLEWSEDIYKTLEGQSKKKAKGYVVEFHKLCFGALDIELIYPADRSRVIEELNQTRNCILHRQGTIDEKAAKLCPRLAQYVGSRISPTDPLFRIALKMLLDYTTACIAALVHSPYLRTGLLPSAKNPFE